MILTAKQAMHLALQEAKKGLGFVHPNPPVGCVILDFDYKFLSVGYHKKYGADHAEVSALKKIKDKSKLKKARVFVTLEPCHHTGKTPPCAKALAKFPLHSLCYGATDPWTKSRGLSYLRKKNIKIIKSPYFQQELKNLIAPWTFSFLHKQSFVSLKVAMSLDGKIALNNKKSQWITSQKSREHANALRAEHSAVLVGVNTFLKDNPRLNVRFIPKRLKCKANKMASKKQSPPYQTEHPLLPSLWHNIQNNTSYQPYRKKANKVIILDPNGRGLSFLHKSALLKVHSANQILFCCSEKLTNNKKIKQCIQKTGVKVKFFKTAPLTTPNISNTNTSKTNKKTNNTKQVFFLPPILKNLYQEENIQSVLVEGGGFCLSEFLRHKLAQRLYLYIAPRVLGQGLAWSENRAISKLSQSLDLRSIEYQQIEDDLFLSGFFK